MYTFATKTFFSHACLLYANGSTSFPGLLLSEREALGTRLQTVIIIIIIINIYSGWLRKSQRPIVSGLFPLGATGKTK